MRLRHVVTCFLLNPADGTVLLGRRSEAVSTYPGRWAAISGSVEIEQPLRQAYREIEEESGLAPAQVEFLREGLPVRFADWSLGTVWVVHPFLFRCNAPQAVRRDWEHLEFAWTEPERMAELDTVPKLLDAYRSASCARSGRAAQDVLRMVRVDRQRGAEELGLLALEALAIAARECASRGTRGLDAFRAVCRRALETRPSMAPVRSAALEAFDAFHAAAREGDLSTAARRIRELIARRERDAVAAATHAAASIPHGARIVTLSRSESVLWALRDAAERVERLVVAESRPACEGRTTARLAASFGIPTTLVTDAAAAGECRQCDMLLFGADSILPDGTVVNKTGTFPLCLAARHAGKEALCVATPSKVMPAGVEPALERMDAGELGPDIPGVTVKNACFERVPASLVTRIATGRGMSEPQQLAARARRLREVQDRLLGA